MAILSSSCRGLQNNLTDGVPANDVMLLLCFCFVFDNAAALNPVPNFLNEKKSRWHISEYDITLLVMLFPPSDNIIFVKKIQKKLIQKFDALIVSLCCKIFYIKGPHIWIFIMIIRQNHSLGQPVPFIIEVEMLFFIYISSSPKVSFFFKFV